MKPKTVFVGSLGIALTILSHTISGYVWVIFYVLWIGVYAGVSKFRKKNVDSVLSIYLLEVGIGLLLSAFFGCRHFLRWGIQMLQPRQAALLIFDRILCVYHNLSIPHGALGVPLQDVLTACHLSLELFIWHCFSMLCFFSLCIDLLYQIPVGFFFLGLLYFS